MPVGAEAAGYGGSVQAYTAGRLGAYDAGDADLFVTSTTKQQTMEASHSARVSVQSFIPQM